MHWRNRYFSFEFHEKMKDMVKLADLSKLEKMTKPDKNLRYYIM